MFFSEARAEDNDVIEIQETEVVPVEASPFQSSWTSLVPMILIFAVFYFLLIRPQEKKRKQKEILVSGVKKGEEVVTNSGIFGIVSKVNEGENSIELEIAAGVNVKILKSAVLDIISRKKEEIAHKKIDTKEPKKKKG